MIDKLERTYYYTSLTFKLKEIRKWLYQKEDDQNLEKE